MSRPSAADARLKEAVQKIDQELVKNREEREVSARAIALMDARITGLLGVRALLTDGSPPSAPERKRTRKAKATDPAVVGGENEATFAHRTAPL